MPSSVKKTHSRRAVLITGASSGIGLAFVKDFLTCREWGDYDVVVMVARQAKKLKKTADHLKKEYTSSSPRLLAVAIDLSKPDGVEKVMAFVKRNHLQITTLVNNAGIGYMGNFADMDEGKIKEIVTLNVTTLTKLCHSVLPLMQAHRSSFPSVIINVASVVGLFPFPLTAVYAASKAYVVNFSEALRSELKTREQGEGRVEVYTLCPGSTRTAFFDKTGQPRGLIATDHFMDAQQVVVETRKAVVRKQGFIIPGIANRLIPLLARILSRRWVVRIGHWFMRRRLGR